MFLYLPHTDPTPYTLGTWKSTVTTAWGTGRCTCQSNAQAIPSPDLAVTAFPKAHTWENHNQASYQATYKQELCSPQHSSQQSLGFAAHGSCCCLAALQLTVCLEQLTSMVSKPVKVEQPTLSLRIGSKLCSPPRVCPGVFRGIFRPWRSNQDPLVWYSFGAVHF